MRVVSGAIRHSASDLASFLACRHLSRLDLAHARGRVDPPVFSDLGMDALAERGERHEAEVLQGFRDRGWGVADLRIPDGDHAANSKATSETLATGVEVVYQGTLLVDDQLGRPDFLVRADLLATEDGRERTSTDRPTYEVVDAKLARSAKARAVLQTAFYSRLLAAVLGTEPEYMYLALGTKEFLTLRVADYAAYERQVDALLREALASDTGVFPPQDTYPEPVEHCSMCRWRGRCIQQRRTDDDLSLVAGMTSRQRKALKDSGIPTRRAFAALKELPRLEHVGHESLARAQAQAQIQVRGEDEGRILWEFLAPEREEDGSLTPDRGLLALPEPAEGDLFFDIEGARYYSEDGKEFGLQYLFGIIDASERDADGSPAYHAFWAFDRNSERQAFEDVVDFIEKRMEKSPGLHVYHYNHYEPTSLDHLSELHETREEIMGRLMGRFATREDEIDDLLRRRVFVDLYRVVRQGIRASVENYSIKRLEPLYGYRRDVELDEVNERLVTFELQLDAGAARDEGESRRIIQGYNEDDCRSTLGLRDWLEARRADLARELGEHVSRPAPPEPPEERTDPEVAALREVLLAGVPAEDRSPEHEARALMADLLEWHRRDAKPAWWRFFRLHDLTDEELIGEPDAVSGLELVGNMGEIKRSYIVRYRFPPQEHPFSEGARAEDPRTGKPWEILSVDEASGFIDLKRGFNNASPHPKVLIEGQPYSTKDHRVRLRELAARTSVQAGPWEPGPELDLLLGRQPNVDREAKGSLRRAAEDASEAGRRIALALRDSHLPIQGPPGSGKTYTGAMQVLALVSANQKVGITANSHAVIRNILDEVAMHSRGDSRVRLGQKPDADGAFQSANATQLDNAGARDALRDGEINVLGGTTWLWAREEFRDLVDVLIVDEAGQMSLANVLAAAHSGRNLILLGDPLQLGQPSAAAHPPGAGISVLERILGDHPTMPDNRGLFIEHTRRMHPDVCRFTSEVFYEGRLTSIAGLERQRVEGPGRLTGAGFRICDVQHSGNDDSSTEEAAVVAELVEQFAGQRWRDVREEPAAIGVQGVLVVTPFNAQIREIQRALDWKGIRNARVGTVDKFQGQQAPVVIYSMASSTAENAPRGMEFLYDLKRLNVATSRAQCLVVLVSSPDLVRVLCKTPRQMQLANALCRLREMASEGSYPG